MHHNLEEKIGPSLCGISNFFAYAQHLVPFVREYQSVWCLNLYAFFVVVHQVSGLNVQFISLLTCLCIFLFISFVCMCVGGGWGS